MGGALQHLVQWWADSQPEVAHGRSGRRSSVKMVLVVRVVVMVKGLKGVHQVRGRTHEGAAGALFSRRPLATTTVVAAVRAVEVQTDRNRFASCKQ